MADDQFLCSEENCQLPTYDPTLCFEPGEQLSESEIDSKPFMPKTAQIITENITEEEINMKGTCENCERSDITIVSGGFCSTCLGAAKGKTGEAREKALAEIAEKIKKGEIKARGVKMKAARRKPVSKKKVNSGRQEDVVLKLLSRFHECFGEAKEIYGVLSNLKKFGVEIELPEVKFP